MQSFRVCMAIVVSMTLVAGCGRDEPVSEARYKPVDALFAQLTGEIDSASELSLVVEIDHSRLAAREGEVMPPSRVALVAAPALEARLLALNQRVALDLPLRVLAYEGDDGAARVLYNGFDFLAGRYGLDTGSDVAALYREAMTTMLAGIDPGVIAAVEDTAMPANGIIDLVSEHDFEETLRRVWSAVDAQSDTVWFGQVDYRASGAEQGIDLRPTTLLLYGGPAPGGKAMAEAPVLGLDAFCQKLLVWQDEQGRVHVSFNDLLALAERHGVAANIPLRVIMFRIKRTFETALAD